MCQAIKTISASLAVSVTFTCEKQEMTSEHSILQRIMSGLACLYFGIAWRLLSGFRAAVCKVQYKTQAWKLALLTSQIQRIWLEKGLCLREDCKKQLSYPWFLPDVPRGGKVICSTKVPCHMLIWFLYSDKKNGHSYQHTWLVLGVLFVVFQMLTWSDSRKVDILSWHAVYCRTWHSPKKYPSRYHCFWLSQIACLSFLVAENTTVNGVFIH